LEHSFWHERWKTSKIGFHLNESNPILKKNFETLNLKFGSTVLVPLCGKSLDLIYIKELGFDVIGFELNLIAVESFFKENNIDFEIVDYECFKCYRSDRITIYVGDFLQFPKELLEGLPISGIYDRAALVALPLSMRKDYYQKMISLYPIGSKVLCVTFEYDDSKTSGPPFSVNFSEVDKHLNSYFKIMVIEKYEGDMDNPRLSKEGCNYMIEKVLLLEKLS
jgi:thiopurine S-methyltransferase